MFRRFYGATLLALLTFIVGGVFSNGLFFLHQPYQLNYGEGLVAWQAAHITDPARAYAAIDHYPYVVFQYPPLFHLATRAMGRVSGDFLAAGRSVSLISAGVLCVVIGWTTFQSLPRRARWQARLFSSVLAGALPATLYNFRWTWLARVDTLAILLSFAGVAIFAAFPKSAWAQIGTSALVVAALFTRQTALAAPFACLLVACLLDRAIGIRLLLTMSLLGGGALGWLAWWTDGQVLLHLFRYNQNPFSAGRAALGVLMNARHVAGLLVLAAAASLAVLWACWNLAKQRRWDLLRTNLRANGYRRRVLLLALYSVLAAVSALAFGKEGSDINYFLEWNVSLAPLAGILLFRIAPPPAGPARLRPAWLAALALPLLLFDAGFDQARDGWLRRLEVPAGDRQRTEVFERALAEVRAASGPVFSEDMSLLYKAGKEIPADPTMIECLSTAKLWDQGPFVRMIEEQKFGLIVAYGLSSRERYSPEVAGAIENAYLQTATIGDYKLYRPRAGIRFRP